MKFWYSIEGFCPPWVEDGRTSMSQWGFSIRLCPHFVHRCLQIKMPEGCRFQELAEKKLDLIWDVPLFNNHPLRFYNETVLLTNITVPGNACGLDMDWNHLHAVEFKAPEEFHQYQVVSMNPHNVDCRQQQYSLLVCFMVWAHFVRGLLGEDWF
ncbi:hypothetical protein LCGC14_2129090 [marine sediment metagenome]|uniref:Uncharacterized protein n=1 Tax=marine sediment metagenome TaxID=412755 RepID=A0A0F9E202_9ZZZZ